jgi:hypothetical protein
MLLGVMLSVSAAVSAQTQTDELRAAYGLIDALEREYAALKQRLAAEQETAAILTELNITRRGETEALRETIAAKNEALAAKDAAIAAQDRLIGELKRKKPSVWKRIGDIAVGAVVGAILN